MNNEIIAQDNGQVPADRGDLTLSDSGLIALSQRADKLVQALKIIRAAVLKLTNERDWENLGGKPYLNEGGSKKVGTAFGVSWQIEEPSREDYEDGHFDYFVSGTFSFRGTSVEEIGTRSSRDDFFRRSRGTELPPSEIDRNDVKKAAVTNCIARGVKAILALRNYTWDELKAAGINVEAITKVSYDGKDPNAVPTFPYESKYFPGLKGKPIDDPSASLQALDSYLKGVEKSIADPDKAQYKARNEKLRDALKDVIEKRQKPEEKKEPAEGSMF